MTAEAPIMTDPYKGLVRVSCIINSIHDYDHLLTSLLQITKEVMNCDASSLMLYHESTHDLSWHVALGEKADKLREMGRLKMGQGVAGWVAENRKSTLVEDASQDQRFFKGADTKTGFKTRSIICVPLVLGEKLVGVLQALNPLHKPTFNQADLDVFEAYGAMAATAIEKIRWQEAALQQQKMDQELEIAREIQARFLSQEFPCAHSVMDFAFFYQPAFQVGGDFYDIHPGKDGGCTLIVGDVTGKGVPAALLMAQVLSEFRHSALHENDPAVVLRQVNDSLSSHSARGMFATAWCAVVHPCLDGLKVRYASAGHLPPIWRKTEGLGSMSLDSGLPLGLVVGGEYSSLEIEMAVDDVMCVYTDGVSEARNPEGEEYGADRLGKVLRGVHGAGNTQKQVLSSVQGFCNGAAQRDDVTLFIFGPRKGGGAS